MLKSLYLRHFRNYTQAEVSFSPECNWITGKNAQGKTNLLEAIYLLSTGRSFRTHQLEQLIQKGAPFFYLEALIEKEGITQTLKVSFDGENKKVQYNANSYSHFNVLIGLLPHILYAPEDLTLISLSPALRRKFLNLYLAQMNPLYIHHLTRYDKAMRQRNELLKKRSEEAIEPWEEIMAWSGQYLVQKRETAIQELQAPLTQIMKYISSSEDVAQMRYHPSLPFATTLNPWQKTRPKELHLGTTLHGPHRDELHFLIDDLSAKSFASEGQKHSFLAALRLAQCQVFQEKVGEPPLLSIDDFGAHLDYRRQCNFQEKLSSLKGQIFLTSPKALPEIFPGKGFLEIASAQIAVG